MDPDALVRCQDILDYQFTDVSVLDLALTHSSVAPSRQESNERLEFLGDAVLGLSICTALHEEYDNLLEGEMTKIKSSVVSRRTCAIVAREIGLCECLSLGGDLSDPSRVPESVAAGVFESVIGAIYVDGGFEPADRFILGHLQPYIEEALENRHQRNFKSLLQQHAQRVASSVPEYVLLDEQGPDHSKCFEVAVVLDGKHYPSAWGRSKKESEQTAAKRALEALGLLNPAPVDQKPQDVH